MKFLVIATLIAAVAIKSSNSIPASAVPVYRAGASAYQSQTETPQPYSFSWQLSDAPTYNNFAHSENSDGKVVSGSYRVALPDGRTQIVTYKSDSNGYVAMVKYEGEAKYPEYKSYSTPIYRSPTPVNSVYKASSRY